MVIGKWKIGNAEWAMAGVSGYNKSSIEINTCK